MSSSDERQLWNAISNFRWFLLRQWMRRYSDHLISINSHFLCLENFNWFLLGGSIRWYVFTRLMSHAYSMQRSILSFKPKLMKKNTEDAISYKSNHNDGVIVKNRIVRPVPISMRWSSSMHLTLLRASGVWHLQFNDSYFLFHLI